MKKKNLVDDPGHEPVNPFRFDFDIPWYRYLQILVGLFTLFPLRLCLLALHLIVIYICAFITTYGLPRIGQTYEMTGWRAWMKWFITKGLWRTMVWSAGVKFTVKGKMASKKEAPIVIASPHSSILDNLLAPYVDNPFFTVARNEQGVVATILRVICPIFNDRNQTGSADFSINELDRRVRDPSWPQVLLWPEGTTHNRMAAIRHKVGSYKPGLPIQPIVLRFPNKWTADVWTFKGPGVPALWFYTLLQFWTNIEVEYLPVYNPNKEEQNDARLYADNVRDVIANHLDVPAVDLGREDGFALLKADELGLPDCVGLVNINFFLKNFGYGRDYIYAGEKSALVKFASLSQEKELADYDDLCLYLLLPRGELMKQLFAIYDRNQMYCFTFRDFLYIRGTRADPALESIDLDNIFNCFDRDHDGKLSFDDVTETLRQYFGGQKVTYRRIWDRHVIGDIEHISLKMLSDILSEYPEYALLYQLAKQSSKNG